MTMKVWACFIKYLFLGVLWLQALWVPSHQHPEVGLCPKLQGSGKKSRLGWKDARL